MDVTVLKLNLHGTTMGYLAGFRDGRNILTFAPDYANNPLRPTFSLITHPDLPNAEKLLTAPWIKRQRLHPVLSNLLPEGALRELLAQGLKVHTDNEFQLFTYLGQDLPGALVATPMEPEHIPGYVLQSSGQVKVVQISAEQRTTNHFFYTWLI